MLTPAAAILQTIPGVDQDTRLPVSDQWGNVLLSYLNPETHLTCSIFCYHDKITVAPLYINCGTEQRDIYLADPQFKEKALEAITHMTTPREK